MLAHLVSLAGVTIPGGSSIFALHVGIFVVWLAMLLLTTLATRQVARKELWKTALSGCPRWMRLGVSALFGYAAVNFELLRKRADA